MSTPAGWYDDGSGRQRWWDGQQWTEHFAPETEGGSAPAEAAPTDAADFDADATVLREDLPSTSEADAPSAYDHAAPSDAGIPGYAPPAAPGYVDANATAAYPGAYQAPDATQSYNAYPPAEPTGPKRTPVLGFVGFGLAILGTILACIPATVIFGVVVLLAAFVVSLIAIFQKNTKKWPSITGLILSVVGGIVGIIVLAVSLLFAVGDAVDQLPSSAPTSESDSFAPQDSDEPNTESTEGRPSAEEVAVGLEEIIAATGQADQLTDEQIACYAEYFVASDIPDDTLWVIASGEEMFSDMTAASEFSEKFTDGIGECLVP